MDKTIKKKSSKYFFTINNIYKVEIFSYKQSQFEKKDGYYNKYLEQNTKYEKNDRQYYHNKGNQSARNYGENQDNNSKKYYNDEDRGDQSARYSGKHKDNNNEDSIKGNLGSNYQDNKNHKPYRGGYVEKKNVFGQDDKYDYRDDRYEKSTNRHNVNKLLYYLLKLI